ncbi:GntR family transcriptional regulator [Faecalicatena sp. AGMB00832]|uniref:GntR family transcriptional regulator n=1 Tax=Faecalicatena faecalis TaxID=2726362 RepID=A0ABS6CYM2_9FIRM|nr:MULTISPECIES: GntR family transcriptional regulator [Faecalicatena]MBU3874240.1 GntR family transcriptional regulator [Faecalicatena faecalis]MCI6465306.1 GntR family transcriptional regulator [Faecalicatena sp.]MDY5617532.1 GntR family transcriptional regulator [Lachnospiraceae bacterium]
MNINPDSKVPLYLQLKEYILEKIKNNEWAVGEKLPTETELQDMLGISRITVRHALELLENEGYIVKKRAKGTFVAPPKFSYHLPKLTSFSEDIIQKNCIPGSKTKVLEVITNSAIASHMGVAEVTPLIHLVRLRTVNNIVMSMHDSYYNLNILDSNMIIKSITSGSLKEQLDDQAISLYSILENEHHTVIDCADESLKAISCPPEIAEQLGISVDDPLLYLERMTYTRDGDVLEFSKMYNRADIYNYTIHLTR